MKEGVGPANPPLCGLLAHTPCQVLKQHCSRYSKGWCNL